MFLERHSVSLKFSSNYTETVCGNLKCSLIVIAVQSQTMISYRKTGFMCLTCTLFLCVGLQRGVSDNMQIIKLLEENKQVVFIFCFLSL